ncbi:MAG: hypothetical protein HRT72_02555 [Flavobacteriales bacterium]|nr:hypothetical protein [Flavobacteriales bacterium]
MERRNIFIIGGVMLFTFLAFGCGNKGGSDGVDASKKEHVERTKTSKLVDAFTYNAFVKSLTDNSEFGITERHDIKVGIQELSIVASHIDSWEDPGDFLKFELIKSSGEILIEEINVDGWVRFGDNYPVPQELLAKNKLDSDKFLWLDVDGKNYLFFVGWMYSGNPGTMTVVDLDERKICVNKKFKITGIEDHNNDNVKDILGKVSLVDNAVIDIAGEDILNL